MAGWQADINGPSVSALAVAGNVLYVGGGFTTLKGQPRSKVGAVNADTAALLSFNPNVTAPGGGFNGAVNAIAVRNNTVFLGGQFNQVGGQSRNNLAAVDATSGAVQSWQADAVDRVSALTIHGETLYVAGQFTLIGGQQRRYLAAVDATSAAVRAWQPDAVDRVATLSVADGTAYAGGLFRGLAYRAQGFIGAVAVVTARTDPPLNVSGGNATLRGTVTAFTDPNATVAFVWGQTPGGPYPNLAPAIPSPLGSTNPISVTSGVGGLVLGQAYFYRLRVITTGGDQVFGGEQSFINGGRAYLPVVRK